MRKKIVMTFWTRKLKHCRTPYRGKNRNIFWEYWRTTLRTNGCLFYVPKKLKKLDWFHRPHHPPNMKNCQNGYSPLHTHSGYSLCFKEHESHVGACSEKLSNSGKRLSFSSKTAIVMQIVSLPSSRAKSVLPH